MSLEECFANLKDPRRGQGLRTDLTQVLIMTVMSYLCGHFGYRGIARFCKLNEELFSKELSLRHGVPSHVTFRDVLSRVDEVNLIDSFNKWALEARELEIGQSMSIDGKTLGGTVVDTQGSRQDFEGVVSIFNHESGLVYAVEHYRRKSKEKGEAPLARHLIKTLKNKGLVFTMDALHSQKKRYEQ